MTCGENLDQILARRPPIHLIGGGGVGMSALGMFLLNQGYRVSASDQSAGGYLDKLASMGATVWSGSQPKKIEPGSVVFHSSAIPPHDAERKWAQENGLTVLPRHELLRILTSRYFTIAVSGTHGKTTTTAWVATLLEEAGFTPSALVGGTVHEWSSNVKLGGKSSPLGKPVLVIEADESDGSFLYINAAVAVVTNVDLDHVDRYSRMEEVEENFRQFINRLQKNGARTDAAKKTHEPEHPKSGCFVPTLESLSLLTPGQARHESMQPIMERLSISAERHSVLVKPAAKSPEGAIHEAIDEPQVMPVGLSGLHNLYNASAVVALGLYLGIGVDLIAKILKSFRGVGRRMEIIAAYRNRAGFETILVDDYAHHPKEIETVMNAYRSAGYLVKPCWEPHRVSRFCAFYREYRQVLNQELENRTLVLFPVFDAAGEEASGEFPQFRTLYGQIQENSIYIEPDHAEQARGFAQQTGVTMQEAQQKTVILFVGAGNSSRYVHELDSLLTVAMEEKSIDLEKLEKAAFQAQGRYRHGHEQEK